MAKELEKDKLWEGGDVRLKFSASYDRSRSTTDSKYVNYKLNFTIKALPASTGQWFGNDIRVSAKINGISLLWGGNNVKTFKESSVKNWNSDITYSTDELGVVALSGTLPIVIHLESNAGSARTKDYTYNLEVPPAVASITSVRNNEEDDGDTPIKITAGNDKRAYFSCDTFIPPPGAYHKMKVVANSLTLYDLRIDSAVYVTLSRDKLEDLIESMTTSSTTTATFTVTTYSDSSFSKVLGSSSRNATIVLADDVKPSITNAGSISWSRGTKPEIHINGKYVQNETFARLSGTTSSIPLGATLKHYEITVSSGSESKIYKATALPYDIPLEMSGTVSITICAVDTRDRRSNSVTMASSMHVYTYSPPKIETYSSERCDSGATTDTDGAYFKANMTCSYSPLNDYYQCSISGTGATISQVDMNNTMWLEYSYKKSSEIVYSTKTEFELLNGTSLALGSGDIDTSSSYDIKYTIYDQFYPDGIDVIDYVSTAQFTLFLAKGGNVVSIGEAYTPTAQEIEDKTKILNIAESWDVRHGTPPAEASDIVIAQGVTENGWHYRKWNSGVLEQRKIVNTALVSVGSWGYWDASRGDSKGYVAEISDIEFDMQFYDGNVSATVLSCGAHVVFPYVSQDISASGFTVRGWRPTKPGANEGYSLSVHAVGVWKGQENGV